MTRNGWGVVFLLAAVGCATGASVPSSVEYAPAAARVRPRPANVDYAPAILGVAGPVLGAGGARTYLPQRRGIGYYWIGYIPADFGVEDLRDVDAGDGFSFGIGLAFTESRVRYELGYEKTVNHEYLFPDDPYSHQTGYHSRLFAGVRSGAVPAAATDRKPSPYASLGLSSTLFGIDRIVAEYRTQGFGFYAGIGAELPYGERTSVSFDLKYHAWRDRDSILGEEYYTTAAFSILWLNRF